VKVTCTGESSSGEITGLKAAGNLVMRFTGCESAGAKCTTAGSAEREWNRAASKARWRAKASLSRFTATAGNEESDQINPAVQDS
jgi:hypothetical protein